MSFTSGRRDLTLVVVAKAVSFLGDEVATVALLLRLQGSGAGAGAVAALLIANLAPIALLSGPVGRLVDRRDNRALLLASSAAQAVVCAVLAFVSGTPAVLALVAVLGVGQAVNGATWQALVPALVPAERLAHAIGRMQMATTSAGMAAPALAGLLVGRYGTRVPLLVDAATFVAVLTAAALLRIRRVPSPSTDRLRGGVAIVRAVPVLRCAVTLLGTFVLLGAMVNVVEVFLVRESLHASVTWYGLVGAGHAVGLLVGAAGAGRALPTQLGRARAVGASAGVLGGALVAIGVSPTVGWVLAATLVTGFANGVLNVATGALVMAATAPEERGRVGAVLTGVVSGTQLGALAVGAALAGVLSPRAIFVWGGTLALLAPLLLGRSLTRAVLAEDLRAGQALFSRRSRLGVSRGTSVG